MSHGSAACIAARMDYRKTVLADAPIWADLLDAASGATTLNGDYSGNGRNGATIDATVAGGTAPAAAHAFNKAFTLNAYEGSSLAVASWMTPAAVLCAEIWCYFTSYPTNNSIIFARSDVNGVNVIGNKAWHIGVGPTGVISSRAFTSVGNTQSVASAAATIPLNTVCHCVLILDGTNIKLRVNKAQVATNTLSGVPVTSVQNTKPLTIGKDSTNGVAGGYSMNGFLWGAALYDTVPTTGRFDLHYDIGIL